MTLPHLILIPVAAGAIAQCIKYAVAVRQHGFKAEYAFREFWSYGGMPSAHAAFIVSLTTAVGLWEGWRSPIFAVSFVVTVFIIRDAVGLRQILSQQSIAVNRIVRDLPSNREERYPGLRERVGHTPA